MSDIQDQIYIVNQFQKFSCNEELQQTAYDWLTLCRLISTPESYYIDEDQESRTFDLTTLQVKISTLDVNHNQEVVLLVKSNEGEFALYVYKGTIRERLLISKSAFLSHKEVLLDYVDRRMEQNGLYAYARDLEEYMSHNTQSLSERTEEALTFPRHLPKMYDDSKEVVVDVSQLAGYDFFFHGLCFTSCWKMWFAQPYYHTLPKKAFLDIQQVDETKELANEVVRITLYEEAFQWRLQRNLDFQLMFRNQLGFDQLEWRNGVGVLREPYTEFIQLGDRTQMIQYQNTSLQPTVKSEASHFTTRVFNFKLQEYLEGRRYGQLNNRAYFPWQDETKKTMLAYWIINPEYMLDLGLEAFTFYIEQYLNTKIQVEEEEKLQAILRFYVPLESLASLPVEALEDNFKLKGVVANKHRQTKTRRTIQFQSAVRVLQVEFVDVAELQQGKQPKVVNRFRWKKVGQRVKNFLSEFKTTHN